MTISNNSKLTMRDALTLDAAGDELALAIQNASQLSADTLKRLGIALSDDFVAARVQASILGSQALSQRDLIYMSDAFSSSAVALEAAQAAAGGLADNLGNVTYPASPTATCATATFSVPAGSYGPSQSVSLSCSTPGASMYFTTNNSTPTTGSTLYTGAITVSSSETIKVLAVKSGFINSAIASAAYVINGAVAALSFSPDEGSYSGTQEVTISSATSGATFYYTLDGQDPTIDSTLYTGPVSVTETSILQAIGVKVNYVDSDVKSAEYTIS